MNSRGSWILKVEPPGGSQVRTDWRDQVDAGWQNKTVCRLWNQRQIASPGALKYIKALSKLKWLFLPSEIELSRFCRA